MEKDYEDGTNAIRGINYLCFGKNKIMISTEELNLLEDTYNAYLGGNCVSIGFVHSLVGYVEY